MSRAKTNLMRTLEANNHFRVGDLVEWTSAKGNYYFGAVKTIREGSTGTGDLITVELPGGGYRNFYENEVDAVPCSIVR